MSETKITKQLDYSKSSRISPDYRFTKLTPREGSQTVTVTTAGGQTNHFDIPERAFNLSRSILSFDIKLGASGTAGFYNYVPMDCLPFIRQIQLYTRGGIMLADINQVGNVTKVMWKPETKLEKFLAMDNHDTKSGAGGMLQKCNANNQAELKFNDTVIAGVALSAFTAVLDGGPTNAELRTEFDRLGAGVEALASPPKTNARRHNDALIAAGTGALSAVNVAYNEAKYLTVGAAANTASDPTISVKIPLGQLYDTIFELDKTLLFDEMITLRFVWASSDRFCWKAEDPLCPSRNAAAATASATVENLQIFLATEQRKDIINSLRAKINADGMSVMIPYMHVYKSSVGAATSQNITLRFDRGHGRRLQKVYHALFNPEEKKNTMYDHDNRAGTKVASYYTTLDTQRIQDFNIDTKLFEDYMLHKELIRDSAILNSNVYQYNWFHCDSWCGVKPLWDKDPNEAVGLDLTTERRWEFVGATVTAANYQHLSIAVCQKELKITKGMITID